MLITYKTFKKKNHYMYTVRGINVFTLQHNGDFMFKGLFPDHPSKISKIIS